MLAVNSHAVRVAKQKHTYEAVILREDRVEGEHFGWRDMSLRCHVTGSGAPCGGGRIV